MKKIILICIFVLFSSIHAQALIPGETFKLKATQDIYLDQTRHCLGHLCHYKTVTKKIGNATKSCDIDILGTERNVKDKKEFSFLKAKPVMVDKTNVLKVKGMELVSTDSSGLRIICDFVGSLDVIETVLKDYFTNEARAEAIYSKSNGKTPIKAATTNLPVLSTNPQ